MSTAGLGGLKQVLSGMCTDSENQYWCCSTRPRKLHSVVESFHSVINLGFIIERYVTCHEFQLRIGIRKTCLWKNIFCSMNVDKIRKNVIFEIVHWTSEVPPNQHQPPGPSGWIIWCMPVRPSKGHVLPISFQSQNSRCDNFWSHF